MDSHRQLRREICRVVVAMSSGDASEAQCRWLDELVRSDEDARRYVVDVLAQMSDLEWEVRASMPALDGLIGQGASDREGTSAPDAAVHPLRKSRPSGSSWILKWEAVAAALVLAVAAAFMANSRRGQVDQPPVAASRDDAAQPQSPVARLVSNTSFLIDSHAGHAINAGDSLQAGRSVTLFDGVAEVDFDRGASMRLKGPALLAIDEDGVPSLKYGRLIVTNHGDRPFELRLSLATVQIGPDSYVGIDGHGDDAFVYAFEGDAELVDSVEGNRKMIAAGRGLRVRRGARSDLHMAELRADSQAFDFELLMASDRIHVSPDYVAAIEAAQPVAYYRFEDDDASRVPNEMGARHALAIAGDGVRVVHRDGDGVAEFVIRDDAACFTAVEPFDELAGDYSFEVWVKPSHFQWGTIAALVQRDVDEQGEVDLHAMLLELHGANAPPEGMSKAIRFLHRSPPSDQQGGTSCFSSVFYRAQVWQHLAVTKDGEWMRLYINGEQVAEARDATDLPAGLNLIIGQLFSFGTVRPFVGHLDELAVYDRALSLDEIKQHVQIMRASEPPARGGSPDRAHNGRPAPTTHGTDDLRRGNGNGNEAAI